MKHENWLQSFERWSGRVPRLIFQKLEVVWSQYLSEFKKDISNNKGTDLIFKNY